MTYNEFVREVSLMGLPADKVIKAKEYFIKYGYCKVPTPSGGTRTFYQTDQ